VETVSLISIITIALLGSFGHCLGMCGGIVLAYSVTKIDKGWSRGKQAWAHLLYSLGRTLTYTVLGVMFGYLGGVSTFSNRASGVLLIIAGLAMIITGLSLVGWIRLPVPGGGNLAESKWFGRQFRALLGHRSLYTLFILGMLNGLLPCGFVYFFAITAASTASPISGGLVMLIFGLCTIPALFGLGFFVGLSQRTRARTLLVRLAAVAVIIYGCYTLYSGYEYVTDPDKSILDCHTAEYQDGCSAGWTS
jgi:uncharacterized protein